MARKSASASAGKERKNARKKEPGSAREQTKFLRAIKALEILAVLRQPIKRTALIEDICNDLGIPIFSERTMDRDVELLQALGYPIEITQDPADSNRAAYRYFGQKLKAIPEAPISTLELLGLFVAGQYLAGLTDSPYLQGFDRFWARLEKEVFSEAWEVLGGQENKLYVHAPPAKSYAESAGKLSAIQRAMSQNRVCQIEYRGATDATPRSRKIEPRGISIAGNGIYVMATDPEAKLPADRELVKSFKIDRIAAVTVLDERCSPTDEIDIKSLYANSATFFRGTTPQTFRIAFDAKLEAWLNDSKFHPRQAQEPRLADGRIVYRIDAAYEQEIIPRVLSCGELAELIEPAESRDAIKTLLTWLSRQYDSENRSDESVR